MALKTIKFKIDNTLDKVVTITFLEKSFVINIPSESFKEEVEIEKLATYNSTTLLGNLNDVTSLNLFKDSNSSNDEDFNFTFYREKGTKAMFSFSFVLNEKDCFCINNNSSDFTAYAKFLSNYFKNLKLVGL